MRAWRIFIYCYGFFIFGVMCLCFAPFVLPLLLLPETARKAMEPLVRAIAHWSFRFVRWHCHVTGFASMRLHDESRGEASQLLVSNHLSMFDIVLLFSYFPDIHTLVNAKFLNNPLLWPIIRACGYVSLRTESAEDGYRAFDALAAILRSGGRLVLFPEGTRSADGRLGPLKNGPFRLAADFQIPITPLLFTCNQPFLNRRAFFPKEPGCVRLDAYIKPALRPADGQAIEVKQARSDFIRAYEEFIRSDRVLAWNRAAGQEGNMA